MRWSLELVHKSVKRSADNENTDKIAQCTQLNNFNRIKIFIIINYLSENSIQKFLRTICGKKPLIFNY